MTMANYWLEADEQRSTYPFDALTILTVAYLAIPNFCFLLGWLKPQYGAPLSLLLALALYQFTKKSIRWKHSHTIGVTLVVTTAAFVWCIFGGAGHFMYANPDWAVRDAVYGDLIYTPWPLAYGESEGYPLIMRSAIGYFLPPAALSSWLGIHLADWSLYSWTAIGTALFLHLLPMGRRVSTSLFVALLVVVFFSGMDFLGTILRNGDLPIFPLRLEWWVPFSYTSLTGQLFWAPNHTIPIWLITALFYRHWATPEFPRLAVLTLPLLCVWTPFAIIGILPFMLVAALRWRYCGNHKVSITRTQWLLAFLLTSLMVRFMTIGVEHIPALPSKNNSPMHVHDTTQYLADYTLFVLMEFGVLSLILWQQRPSCRGLFLLSVAILLLLPLYQFGPSNDSLLRLSVPPLLLLMLEAQRVAIDWVSQKRLPTYPFLLLGILVAGAHTPFNEILRATMFRRTTPDYSVTFLASQKGAKPPHYIGLLKQPDLTQILARPHPVNSYR